MLVYFIESSMNMLNLMNICFLFAEIVILSIANGNIYRTKRFETEHPI